MKSKITSLSKNAEFKSLLSGKKMSNKYSTIFFKKISNKNLNRLNISFVTKKKLGNAVERNLCKRRIKSLVNEIVKKISLNFKYSYLILAKDNVLKKNSFGDLKKTMFAEFNKIR